jgi:membrane-bound ClpP family serine protease
MERIRRFKTLPQGSKRRIVVKYIIFQVPDMAILTLTLIVLHWLISLPSWLTWGFVSLWVIKDVFMFPFVWSAYEQPPSGGVQPLAGTEGIAEERLAPSGYVCVRGELWQAEVIKKGPPIEKGEGILVQEANGLTLIVQPTHQKLQEINDS